MRKIQNTTSTKIYKFKFFSQLNRNFQRKNVFFITQGIFLSIFFQKKLFSFFSSVFFCRLNNQWHIRRYFSTNATRFTRNSIFFRIFSVSFFVHQVKHDHFFSTHKKCQKKTKLKIRKLFKNSKKMAWLFLFFMFSEGLAKIFEQIKVRIFYIKKK